MLEPIADRVIIIPDEQNTSFAGGLILPDDLQEKVTTGVIHAVGPGKNGIPMQTSVGDAVLYDKYTGKDISLQGKTYVIAKESELLTIIPNQNDSTQSAN